ncbi:MAG: carboxylating nicotinate-nucleotide diphosphorylase [Mariprofundaceae bacterium]|nr:carboxylating nicotinate-nucleotide diphosphorylase [Mariprofundaceae bacterium]
MDVVDMGVADMDIAAIDRLIILSLEEDVVAHDLTAKATIAVDQAGHAMITAKGDGVVSGIAVAERVFAAVDARIEQTWLRQDGDAVCKGDLLARLSGPLRSLLSAERTALNFMQHLSGIATATRAFVASIAGTDCQIVDTRKTTPGLRHLEKQAVRHGGGINHRMDLAAGMLIKENHIAAAGSIAAAIRACRRLQRDTAIAQHTAAWVEVECETLAEVREAVAAEPDIILLDNMTPDQVRAARALVPAAMVLEASGNISLANARSYAETGVHRLAIGAITHSAAALDISMRVASDEDI